MMTSRGTDRGWSREFEEPIPLPKGRQLITLRDAGDYITKLPEAEHTAPEWQAAMEALILVATLGGPTMFARIGVMKALNRHVESGSIPIARSTIGASVSCCGTADAGLASQPCKPFAMPFVITQVAIL